MAQDLLNREESNCIGYFLNHIKTQLTRQPIAYLILRPFSGVTSTGTSRSSTVCRAGLCKKLDAKNLNSVTRDVKQLESPQALLEVHFLDSGPGVLDLSGIVKEVEFKTSDKRRIALLLQYANELDT